MGYNFFTTVTTKEDSKSFTSKKGAADYIGISTVTLKRWIKKARSENIKTIEYRSKKKGKCFRVYFDAELWNKSGNVFRNREKTT